MGEGQEANTLLHKYKHLWAFTNWELTDVTQPIPILGGDTLLHYVAARSGRDEVNLLVSAGADINARGEMGQTPLHHAAIWGRLDVAEHLLALGADQSIRDEFGMTAQETALRQGREEMARLLRRAVKNHWPTNRANAGE